MMHFTKLLIPYSVILCKNCCMEKLKMIVDYSAENDLSNIITGCVIEVQQQL